MSEIVRKPVLETKHLGISFGGLHAVQDFNLSIYSGELVGLIGPNGAGKTTVFNLLTGVYVPTEGTVLLDATFRTPKFWKAEQEITEKAMDLLEICGLRDKADIAAASLPYGQQRKLEIARALATNMKVLLLDEPAAGMNPTETAELLACINTIRDRFGIAILLIEHDMSLVMNVCQQIQVIDYGQTIASGLPEEIAADPRVITAYLGE